MTGAVIIQTRKEVRALLPWTIGVAIACIALANFAAHNGAFPDFRHDQEVFFIIVYALGVLAVAAHSVGQELTHGTLAMLLAQPTNRHKILGLKLGVLAVALVGLGALANGVFPHGDLPNAAASQGLLIWGPVVAGIGLVPLLTMLSGRPLGGVVFAVAIPLMIFTISERLYPLRDGLFAWTIAWSGTLVVSALGFCGALIQFRRFEVAGEGRSRTVGVMTSLDAPLPAYRPTIQRSWIWLLVKKEIRLQQMTLAVSGLCVLAFAGVMILADVDPHYAGIPFEAVAIIHAVVVALIAGSISSAEERQIGSLSGQILQPRSVRAQWAIKAAVTIGLALTLAFGLPLLLMAVHRPVDAFRVRYEFVLAIGILTAAAIYMSSISSNSLWALLGGLPVIGLAVLVSQAGYPLLRSIAGAWTASRYDPAFDRLLMARTGAQAFWRLLAADATAQRAAVADVNASLNVLQLSLIVGFGLLVLYFAARNHRVLDRNVRTITRQMLILGFVAAAATTAYLVTARIAWHWIGHYYY